MTQCKGRHATCTRFYFAAVKRGKVKARVGWGAPKSKVTYNDFIEVLVVGLAVDPRVDDFRLLWLECLHLLLREVWDVPVRRLVLRGLV